MAKGQTYSTMMGTRYDPNAPVSSLPGQTSGGFVSTPTSSAPKTTAKTTATPKPTTTSSGVADPTAIKSTTDSGSTPMVDWYDNGKVSFPLYGTPNTTYAINDPTGTWSGYYVKYDPQQNGRGAMYSPSGERLDNWFHENGEFTLNTTQRGSPEAYPGFDYTFDMSPDSPAMTALKQAITPLNFDDLWNLGSKSLTKDMGYDTSDIMDSGPWNYQKNGLKQIPETSQYYNTDPLGTGKSSNMDWSTNVGLNTKNYQTKGADLNSDYAYSAPINSSGYTTNVNINPNNYTRHVDVDDSYTKNVNYRKDYTLSAMKDMPDDMAYSTDYLGKLDDYNFIKDAMQGDAYDEAYNRLFNTYSQGFTEDQDRQLTNLEQRLINQGLGLGNAAYDQSMQDYNDNYYRQYNKLQQQAASDAYQYALQNAQLNNAATQNQAQNQLANEQLNNAAVAQQFQDLLNDAQLKNAALTQMNNYDFMNAELRNSVLNQLNDYAFRNADLNNSVENWINDYAFKNAALNNGVQSELNNFSLQNAALNNDAVNNYNQSALQNAALRNSSLDSLNNMLLQQGQMANQAKQAQQAAELQAAQLRNQATTDFGNLGLQQQTNNNTALSDYLRLAMAQQEAQNNALSNAFSMAGSLNNYNLQQQMLENSYLYNNIYNMLTGATPILPSGYTGASLSGSGQTYGSQSGSAYGSNGGLLNALGLRG